MRIAGWVVAAVAVGTWTALAQAATVKPVNGSVSINAGRPVATERPVIDRMGRDPRLPRARQSGRVRLVGDHHYDLGGVGWIARGGDQRGHVGPAPADQDADTPPRAGGGGNHASQSAGGVKVIRASPSPGWIEPTR